MKPGVSGMTAVNSRIKFTFDDYCLMPEEQRYELIEGDFYMVPSLSVIHQRVSANIGALLRDYVQNNNCGEIFHAPLDVVLSSFDVVQPDIFYISRERSDIITDDNIQGPPDLVVEILSPATAEKDRTIKKKLYARSGVGELWLVNPGAQAVEVFQLKHDLDKPLLITRSEKRFLTSSLLPGLEINLDDVF